MLSIPLVKGSCNGRNWKYNKCMITHTEIKHALESQFESKWHCHIGFCPFTT